MAWKALMPRTIQEAGITTDGNTTTVPYRRPDGSLFREKLFRNGISFWGDGYQGMLPYGLERLPTPLEASREGHMLVICEGESDTLALREALLPDSGVWTVGCPGAGAWRPEWEVYTTPFWLTVVIGDGDEAGRKFVKRTCFHIPRAVGWTMPEGEDVRSNLTEMGPDKLNRELVETRRLEFLFRRFFK